MALIKTADEIQIMREAGRILASAVGKTLDAVAVGVTTEELDDLFRKDIEAQGCEPVFLGYNGYTKSICASVNDEVVHGIPGDRVLEEGDIVGIDCGVRYKGYVSDMARTVPVGKISEEAQRLITVTRESFDKAMEVFKPGKTLGDIGHAVQAHAEAAGYSLVRALVGHGIGTEMHEEPNVPNYGTPGTGLTLEEGMVLCVEPMVNAGALDVNIDDDEWTVRTADGTLSAHHENTVVVTVNGPEILTVLDR